MKSALTLVVWLLVGPVARAGTLDATQHHAYDANAGWLNASATPAGAATVGSHYLSGQAYSANYGWIQLGSGAPSNGHAYANAGAEFGVNLDPAGGSLGGYGYAANLGWINFGWAVGSHPQRPRVNLLTGQLAGLAWSPNAGWIDLSAMQSLSLAENDSDGDGIDDAWEYQHFNGLRTANATSDHDGDGSSDQAEAVDLTDPDDPSSALRILAHAIAGGNPLQSWTVTFTSHAARLYRIETSPDLGAGHWVIAAPGAFAPDGGVQTTRVTEIPNAPGYFLRVGAVNPLHP
jgi:hypothetical protein